MIAFQNEDASVAADGQNLRRRRNAVTDRGDQRDVGGIGIDQAGSRCPRALVLLVCESGIERPGRALAPDRGAAGLQGAPLRPTAARPASRVRSGSGL
jgi:hypothetical protein